MRKQRRRDDGGSLELLLDTITNTFGGILLIAILLSLLLQTSSRTAIESAASSEPLSALEQAQLEERVTDLQQEAESLRRRVDEAPQQGDSEADQALLDRLTAIAAEIEDAVTERAAAVRGTLESQRQTATANEQCDSLEQDQELADRKRSEAEQQLAAARQEAARLAEAAVQVDRVPEVTEIEQTVSLPDIRESPKRQVALYIRFDKIFMMHVWRNGRRLGPNTHQFVVTGAPSGSGVQQVARPKPNAGIPVTQATVNAELAKLLRPFPRNDFAVSLVVFEDSFDVFQLIKAALVRSGYEYMPFPLSPGEAVVDFGGRSEVQ